MPNDANKRYLPSSRLRRSILLDRAHVLQRVNVAPLAMLHHAHAPSHVNISYAYLFVYLQIQIYNEDKRWSGETSCISSQWRINRTDPTRKESNFMKVFNFEAINVLIAFSSKYMRSKSVTGIRKNGIRYKNINTVNLIYRKCANRPFPI